MKVEFDWKKTVGKLAQEKCGGEGALKFLANQAKEFMNPYVPAKNNVLAQNVRIYAEGDTGVVEYDSDYAHYQYEGELYVSSVTGSPWAKKGEYKVPAGKKLEYGIFRHPLATSHWDKAMMTARKGDLTKAVQNYLKKGGKR